MAQHQFIIKARYRLETLERIFRVVRHRGSRIHSINMNETENGDTIFIHLVVSSERPVALLLSQLNKLIDVTQVEIKEHS